MSLMPAVGPVNQSNVRRRLAVVDVETARAAITAPDIVPHEMLAALRASIEPSLTSSSLEPHPLPISTSTDPIQTSNPFVSISNWMPNADAAEATPTCLHLVAIGITTEMATKQLDQEGVVAFLARLAVLRSVEGVAGGLLHV